MRIELDDTHVLNSDQFCVWLTVKVRKKDNTGVYERVFGGYHRDIPTCLKLYVTKSVNASNANSILELAGQIEQIQKDIDKFHKTLKERERNE